MSLLYVCTALLIHPPPRHSVNITPPFLLFWTVCPEMLVEIVWQRWFQCITMMAAIQQSSHLIVYSESTPPKRRLVSLKEFDNSLDNREIFLTWPFRSIKQLAR